MRSQRHRPPVRARQRGVAIITALLLTMLSVTIVASLFWSQQVQVRSMENQRLHLQTKWILRGALDWARLVLRQDGLDNNTHTALTAVWNTPLAETRLDQYIERERVQGEIFDASLSGRIIDATSRYNLVNLSDGRVINRAHLLIFQRLLTNLQIDPALARKTAELVASSSAPAQVPLPGGEGQQGGQQQGGQQQGGQQQGGQQGGDQAPLQPVTVKGAPIALTQLDDLLAIPGYTREIVAKLREFVIVLPVKSPVNVNTAPAEVIAALVENYSVSEANALVARRKQAYYRQMSDFEQQLYGKKAVDGSADVKSDWFLVLSRVRLDRAALDAEALISRKLGSPGVPTTTVWVRQN